MGEWGHSFFLLVFIGKSEEKIEPKNLKEDGCEGAGKQEDCEDKSSRCYFRQISSDKCILKDNEIPENCKEEHDKEGGKERKGGKVAVTDEKSYCEVEAGAEVERREEDVTESEVFDDCYQKGSDQKNAQRGIYEKGKVSVFGIQEEEGGEEKIRGEDDKCCGYRFDGRVDERSDEAGIGNEQIRLSKEVARRENKYLTGSE